MQYYVVYNFGVGFWKVFGDFVRFSGILGFFFQSFWKFSERSSIGWIDFPEEIRK